MKSTVHFSENSIDENDPEYWINMGYTLRMQGKSDKAQKYFEKALELDPENVAALNDLANALTDQGKKEEAIKYLKYVTDIYPEIAESWINLGVIYEESNDLDKAMICYDKAKDLDPLSPALYHNRGYA